MDEEDEDEEEEEEEEIIIRQNVTITDDMTGRRQSHIQAPLDDLRGGQSMQGPGGSPIKRSPAFLNGANLEVQLPLIKQNTLHGGDTQNLP